MNFTDIKNKLEKMTVGIAGIGGLGSNCAAALTRSGIGKLVFADFDSVTETNLNRQFYFFEQIGEKKVISLKNNLLRINPKLRIELFDTKLSPQNIESIFSNCDIIIEALDCAEQKTMLIETILTIMPKKIIISGSGMAGWGKNNELRVKQYDNLYICGDNTSEVSENSPPLAPRVGIVANMQANQALEILLAH